VAGYSCVTHHDPAAFFKATTKGSAEKGMDADLVILDADPAGDVRNFAKLARFGRARSYTARVRKTESSHTPVEVIAVDSWRWGRPAVSCPKTGFEETAVQTAFPNNTSVPCSGLDSSVHRG
jgi:hypothetical protein